MIVAVAMLLVPVVAWGQTDDAALLKSMEDSVQRASERASVAVVSIRVDREAEKPPPAGNPMMTGGVFQNRPKNAPTSGTVMDSAGYILTSYFNVSGNVKSITVTLPNGEETDATIVGFHAGADIALLKVEAEGLATLKASPMNQLKVGMPVIALGRAPDGKGLTMNPGMVSAPARLQGRGVQCDTKMNYGNVGGPLVDAEGRLVGVTCKVDVKTAANFGQNSGVSFAITWDHLQQILPELKKGAKTKGTGQPFMGIQWDSEAQVEDGVPILEAITGGSAEAGGIKRGDVILEFDGVTTKNFDELRAQILRKAVGDKIKVRLRRGQEEIDLTLTLGERPGD